MPKLGFGLGLSTGNKRVASYKATGSGLSPNINGMLFYQNGIFNGKPLYIGNNGFFLWYSPAILWVINKTKTTGLGVAAFFQVPPASEPTSKTYAGQYGFTGTVTIVKV